ncbi:MAG: hypothetical protein IJ470_04330 [Clostridia bacterium]|nr:hypothetical protein [Clostridia bacterium]
MNKQKVLVISLAVCLIAILSLGSLAWFSDSDTVTNTFMMADSTEDPDKLFSVNIYETKLDENGNLTTEITGDGEGNTYKAILPGATLSKDPTVKNTGKYDQWVRIKVTLTNASVWQKALAAHNITDLATIFGGYEDTAWTRGETIEDTKADTLTYVYYFNYRLVPEQTAILFTSITIPKELTREDMIFTGGKFDLSVKAEAIQADNTGDTAIAAFENCWKDS